MPTDTVQVIVRDHSLTQPSENALMSLFFPRCVVTASELIRERVNQEVRAYNERLPELFTGLVAPTDAERVLNGYRLSRKRTVDPEAQVHLALEAFQHNGFILLVDQRQLTRLDEPVEIHPGSEAVFIKLTPLVGG